MPYHLFPIISVCEAASSLTLVSTKKLSFREFAAWCGSYNKVEPKYRTKHAVRLGAAISTKNVDTLIRQFNDSLVSVALSTRLESGSINAPE